MTDAFAADASKKGERGEAGDILGDGVRFGSDSWCETLIALLRFLGSTLEAGDGDRSRSSGQEVPLARCELMA